MLGKALGIITAGVFVGAAVLEVLGYLASDLTGNEHGQKPPPAAVDSGVEATKEHDTTTPQAGS